MHIYSVCRFMLCVIGIPGCGVHSFSPCYFPYMCFVQGKISGYEIETFLPGQIPEEHSWLSSCSDTMCLIHLKYDPITVYYIDTMTKSYEMTFDMDQGLHYASQPQCLPKIVLTCTCLLDWLSWGIFVSKEELLNSWKTMHTADLRIL